ncbi:MAG TPA: NAD(P)H-dependent glycerol-3-phosphate dehydrogenase [Pyrinomonadaceae bacterium]|jgi:glycerol-3-phosphate dehydrogenase (NAD(P)+)|nr:NAD(P)H-dependent glycerol-3-phosphate dehydrogenase [Pyrinomonadaceae bacterium]
MRRVAVIGAGSWGTALAILAARAGHEVQLWSHNVAVVEAINRERFNPRYLTTALIPTNVTATNNIIGVIDSAELVVLAAPSHATRELLNAMLPALRAEMIVVSATKGIEIDTGKRISQLVAEIVPQEIRPRFASLSGPSFAKEVAENHPTAVVAASDDRDAARLVQSELSFDNFRIYTNDDVVGTELGGSVKNVMAIAAGMVAGLGYGSNSIAALITRGLAEMTRLAMREGAKLETLMGLAGLGDLVLTCTGSLSRNRFVGQELGKGRNLNEIASGMTEIAEGVKTTLAVKRLAERCGVNMPITNEVHAVLYEGKLASEAARELMTRPLREENH